MQMCRVWVREGDEDRSVAATLVHDLTEIALAQATAAPDPARP
jgi:hypothetical protein